MKRLAKLFAALLAFVLLGVFALILAIPFLLEENRLRSTLADELSKATGLVAHIGKLRLFFPGGIGVRVENFELLAKDGRSLIRSEEIFLGIRTLPLLQRKLVIHRLVLFKPTVRWLLDEEGKPVLVGVLDRLLLKMQEREWRGWLEPSFQLSRVRLEGGTLYVAGQGQPGGTFYEVRFDAKKGGLVNRLQVELSAQLAPGKKAGVLRIVGRTTIPSSFSDLTVNPLSVDVNAQAVPADALKTHVPMLRGLEKIDGTFGLRGHLEGALGKEMQVKGRVDFSSLSLKSKMIVYPQSPGDGHLDIQGVVSPERIQLAVFRLRSDEVSLESNLLITDRQTEDPWIDLRVASPFLEIPTIKEYLPFPILRGPVWPYLNKVLTRGRCRIERATLRGTLTTIKNLGRLGADNPLAMELECSDGAADLVGDHYLPLRELSGRLVLERGVLQFMDFHGNYGRSQLGPIRGQLDGVFVGPDILTLHAKGNIEASEMQSQFQLRFLGESTNRIASEFRDVRGTSAVDLNFRGELGSTPVFWYEGTSFLENVGFRHRLLPLPVSQGKGIIRFSVSEIHSEGLSFHYGTTPFQVKGGISDYRSAEGLARLIFATQNGKFGEVGSLLFPQVPPNNAGTFSGEVLIQGRLGKLEESQVTGRLDFQNVELNPPFLREPFTNIEASAKMNGMAVAIQASGRLAGQPLSASLKMADRSKPVINVALTGKGIDTGLFVPRVRGEGEPLGKIRLEGTAELEQVKLGDVPVDSLSTNFKVTETMWEFSTFSIRSGEGKAQGRAVIANGSRNEGPRFEAQGKVEAIELRDLVSWLGLPPTESTGKVHLQGVVRGFGQDSVERKKNLTGTLHVKVEKGVIKRFPFLVQLLNVVDLTRWLTLKAPDFNSRGLPFKKITTDVQLKEGRYTTENLFLDSDLVKITAAGTIDSRTNTVDFRVAIRPFATVANLIGKIPLIGPGLSLIQGSVLVAHVRVRGPMDDPKIFPAPQDTLTDFFRRALELPQTLMPFSRTKAKKKEEESSSSGEPMDTGPVP